MYECSIYMPHMRMQHMRMQHMLRNYACSMRMQHMHMQVCLEIQYIMSISNTPSQTLPEFVVNPLIR